MVVVDNSIYSEESKDTRIRLLASLCTYYESNIFPHRVELIDLSMPVSINVKVMLEEI